MQHSQQAMNRHAVVSPSSRGSSRWPLVIAVALLAAMVGCRKQPPSESVKPVASDPGGSGRGGARADDGSAGLDGGLSGGPLGGERDGAVGGGPGSTGGQGSGRDGSQDGEDAAITPTAPFTKLALLRAVGDCALARYRDFESRAGTLAQAAQAHAEAPDDARVEAAQAAWLAAMASWQRAEQFRFGPAARSGDPGGQNLRDEIYVFPLANPCRVDQQLVERTYASATFSTSLSSARGLSAIEYLLFHTGSGNACSASIAINANGAWAALGNSEIAQRRADYAAAAAQDVLARATALVQAWEPSGGDFARELTSAGAGSTVFAMDQDALNAVSDALFYVENEVKDLKLGWPLGLVPDCLSSPNPCPNDVESRYARASTDHLRQNLAGFRELFQGCGHGHSGLGFDDWLHEVSAGELATRMLDAITGAERAVDTLSPPLEEALVADIEAAQAVHGAVKALTDLLKTEFVTVLNLELPAVAEGDND
jgi:predicted lipoprotein